MIAAINNYKFNDTLNADSVAIDIGAHIGLFAKGILDKYGCKVYAYEPTLENFEKIPEGIKKTNAVVLDIDGEVDYNLYPGDGGCNGIYPRADRQGVTEKVQAVSLKSILDGFESVDLLKLNVEGSEIDLLCNTPNITKCKQITVEFHLHCGHLFEPQQTAGKVAKCITYLKELGIVAKNVDNNHTPHPDYLFTRDRAYPGPYFAERAKEYRFYDDEHCPIVKHYRDIISKKTNCMDSFNHVLDIGCGTGRYFCSVQCNGLLTGIDPSPYMLKMAEVPRTGGRYNEADLICAGVDDAEFRHGTFDFIYSIGTLGEHIPLTVDVVNKIYSWLKHEASAFITLEAKESNPDNTKTLDKQGVEDILGNSKFTEYEIEFYEADAPKWKGAHWNCWLHK